ncbi:uncharacterized protein B0I36DRAFT_374758 [Microdochium trichocladiopsis]|uniref:DUF6594 domain-containing protein n=1 Tax=Microdochium trichocladiopsis TaxID=1682393 RepID=A0A9P9BM13_9PEZI|nr:uncharacterized protein B0I36DRAFT_374758 [Microdochium trichocladiopsis]KAH7029153.1 hypothetical protein B0I36DRAFT_374758 [Microdochium trichocladiopsis]
MPSKMQVEPKPSEFEVEDKPWKYIGYPVYADFLASDNDLLVFRRFGVLGARVALGMQDELVSLETKLRALDKQHASVYGPAVNNGSLRDDIPERAALLAQIGDALPKYTEQAYIFDEAEDLVSLVERETTPLRSAVDGSLRLRTWWGWLDKGRTDNVAEHDVGVISYYSDDRIDLFVSVAIVFVGIAMLIIPIWILRCLSDQDMMLVVITVFILVFLGVLSFFMATKPFEALGATAAYAAVLMVFLQVGSEN